MGYQTIVDRVELPAVASVGRDVGGGPFGRLERRRSVGARLRRRIRTAPV
jgi:hypothetical protein